MKSPASVLILSKGRKCGAIYCFAVTSRIAFLSCSFRVYFTVIRVETVGGLNSLPLLASTQSLAEQFPTDAQLASFVLGKESLICGICQLTSLALDLLEERRRERKIDSP